ncbi:MAG: hypothetical protein D6766_12480 [Verrucomicrobia bacterium]|nr:MAG: hypothetical protein D6766_12480 [Verrucomicrobiota bacterium]
MARPVRIEFPGACHWIATRALSGRTPFGDPADVVLFRRTLEEAAAKTGWRLLAWAVTPEALEMVLETPQANLVAGMKWLLGVFTARWNRRHQTGGPLFRGRYRSVLIQSDGGPWLREAIEWVHLLPAREGVAGAGDSPAAHPHSSLRTLVTGENELPGVLAGETLRQAAGPDHLERLERLRRASGPASRPRPVTAWCHGDEAFREQVRQKLASGDPTIRRVGTADPVPGVAEAEAIVRRELAALGWDEAQLERTPKSHSAKLRLAMRLRRETTVTIPWIARRLVMGSPHTVRNLLAAARRAEAKAASGPAPTTPETPEEPDAFDVRWD